MIAKGKGTEMRKVQPGEGQSETSANPSAAVPGELSEGVSRRGEDHLGKGAPKVGPAGEPV